MKVEHSKEKTSKIRQIMLSPKFVVGLIVALLMICALWVYTATWNRGQINAQQATDIAYGEALKQCVNTQTTMENCKNIEHIETRNISPGPTDGSDERYSNSSWVVTYRAGDSGLTDIYLSRKGKIVIPRV